MGDGELYGRLFKSLIILCILGGVVIGGTVVGIISLIIKFCF